MFLKSGCWFLSLNWWWVQTVLSGFICGQLVPGVASGGSLVFNCLDCPCPGFRTNGWAGWALPDSTDAIYIFQDVHILHTMTMQCPVLDADCVGCSWFLPWPSQVLVVPEMLGFWCFNHIPAHAGTGSRGCGNPAHAGTVIRNHLSSDTFVCSREHMQNIAGAVPRLAGVCMWSQSCVLSGHSNLENAG